MICLDPFKNLSIFNTNNQLSIGPCCIAKHSAAKSIDFYDKQLVSIRDQWAHGSFPTECNNCKIGASNRIQGNQKWYSDRGIVDLTPELIRLDYWVGDTCNLQCVICGPENSSSWKKELGLITIKRTVNPFWKDVDLTKLQYVHLTGGEPLLSKEHLDFLNAIPDKSKVRLDYNTNGTILPNQSILDLWAKFDLVQLNFSIDDIGKRFEYIRYPASWDQVISNLDWFYQHSPVNVMFAVGTSIGILNQKYLPDLVAWMAENFSSNRLGDPVEHRIQDVSGILSKISPRDEVKIFLDQCDARRKTNWRDLYPELIED